MAPTRTNFPSSHRLSIERSQHDDLLRAHRALRPRSCQSRRVAAATTTAFRPEFKVNGASHHLDAVVPIAATRGMPLIGVAGLSFIAGRTDHPDIRRDATVTGLALRPYSESLPA